MLSDRERAILRLIIENYLETGDPVGSRTIEKSAAIGLSSATIRNVMSDLEDMGYLQKPHTSSGRIPSHAALGEYVDALLHRLQQEDVEEHPSDVALQGVGLEDIITSIGNFLSSVTNCAAMTFLPEDRKKRIREVFVKELGGGETLFFLMTDDGECTTSVLPAEVGAAVSPEKLNNFLRKRFFGRPISELIDGVEDAFYEEVISSKKSVDAILRALDARRKRGRDLRLIGLTKLLLHPDFTEPNRARSLAKISEQPRGLEDLFIHAVPGLTINIGSKDDQQLENFAVITSNYFLRDGQTVGFGILAPIRVNYEAILQDMLLLDRTFRRVLIQLGKEV